MLRISSSQAGAHGFAGLGQHVMRLLLASSIWSACTAADVTPAQWLDAQPKPAFKAGHTLPRLTRYGWECLPLVTGKPLAEDWGYALEFTRYLTTLEAVAQIDDPTSREAQTVALARSDPERYKLSVATVQAIPFEQASPNSFTRNAAGVVLNGAGISADGNSWGPNGPLISPEAPDALWEAGGELRAAPLRALIARGVTIDNVMNGGETGLGIPGFAKQAWDQDPVIAAAIGTSPWGRVNIPNYDMGNDYASAKKGISELIMARMTKAAVPRRSFFNYYTAGGGTVRNKDWAVDAWGPRWQHTRGTNDFPSNEVYFGPAHEGGWTDRLNVLTKALNAASLEIATGDTLSYNWISDGWDEHIADVGRWTGFLKCYYTAGMIGANTGFYAGFTKGQFEAPFSDKTPPAWLTALVATSYVHALFSHLEDLIRNGDLLPGPAQHGISREDPAYEFPTGDDTARVLVRRHRGKPAWLIAAWAAAGADRTVSIFVPELGQVSVEARKVGSVYTATLGAGKVTLIRHDDEGATYSAVKPGSPVVSAVNLTIPVPTKDRLLWFVADRGVTADAEGKVEAWASQGSVAVTVSQKDAARRPTLVADAVAGSPAIRCSNAWLENLDLGTMGESLKGPLTVYAVFTGGSADTRGSVVMGVAPDGNPWKTGQGFAITNQPAEDTRTTNGVMVKANPSPSVESQLRKLIIGENDQPGSGYGHTGDIAEILVYKGQSGLNQESVRLYLEHKYHISRDTTLVNGDFEFPKVTEFHYTPCPSTTHSRGPQGWFFANQVLLQANGSSWSAPSAPSGVQTAVLQGDSLGLGNMSQMVHLSAGSYTIGFKAARRRGQIQPIEVSVDQVRIGSLITPKNDAFEACTTSAFTVTDGVHLIRLEATDSSGDKSTFVDDVRIDGPQKQKSP